jgi:DNA repair protein RecO (recombination protein O)
MLIRAPAILCASFAHGEHGAVARLFTADYGLLAAYVAGARGRMLRPLLIPGNVLEIELNERGDNQLASVRLELVVSRGPWLTEPLASAGIGWAAALTAATLPEAQPFPALHSALLALLDAICLSPSARGWARALAGYEALVLREAGYAGGHGLNAAPPADMPWAQLLALLDRQGAAIGNHLLADRKRDVMAARAILMDRLKRMTGD